MKRKNFVLLFLFLILACAQVLAQTKKEVRGIVKDVQGLEVIGAAVVEKGTSNGTVTDMTGAFTLSVSDNATLEISFVGYATQTLKVAGKSDFNIVLKEDTEVLEEVVVTAYGGTQLRSKLTNSISKVDDKVFKNGAFSNPAKALVGSVAGLSVVQASGSPTSSPQIVLRGGTNFDGSGSPLYIVDGQLRGTMFDLNPDDIESMEVMKDAGSTAIYGARANNGVILITTKKGKKGKTSFNFNSKVALNYFNNPYEFLNARDYLYYFRYANYNAARVYQDSKGNWNGWSKEADLKAAQPFGTGNKYFDSDGNPLDGNKNGSAVWSPMIYTPELSFLLDRGWQTMTDPIYGDEIIFYDFNMADVNIKSPSVTQDYSLSMSGGNDKGGYFASLGFNDDNGQAPGNFYKRLNFTINADYQLRKWVKSISSFKFSKADWKGLPASQSNESNYFGRVLGAPPTMRGYNHDGEMIVGMKASDGNQLVTVDQRIRETCRNQFDMHQAFDFSIIDGLKLRISGAWLYSETYIENFDKDFISSPGVINKVRTSFAKFDRNLSQTYTGTLNYNKTLGNHYLDAMAGMEYYSKRNIGFEASGSGAPTDDFRDLALTLTDEGKRKIDSWHNEQRILSFFGRLNYDYMSKYLLSFVIRKDGYSKLFEENRWGVFPGVSAGWVFGKESFMEPLKEVVSFAKLRASYGINGNVSGIGNYDLQGSYNTNKYNGNVGFVLGGLPNPYLVWEKSHTVEFGLDLGLLENRINANFAYYNRRTKDKFASIDIPASSGITSFKTNNGEIQNQGFEMDFGFKIIQNKDFSWNLNLNGAFQKNKVISLPYNGVENNRQGGTQIWDPSNPTEKIWVGGYQEGQRPGDIVAYEYLGVYKSYDEIPGDLIDRQGGRTLYGPDAWAKLSDAEKAKGWPIQPGDAIWKDVNGDGIIDQYDQVKVGNRNPTFTGGINTTLSWKGLSLTARMDYALGHKLYDSRTQWIMGAGQGSFNTITETKDAFLPGINEENAIYPIYTRADASGKRNYQRTNTMFVKNGNYLAFRELSLSYELPQAWLSKLDVNRLALSVTGRNLGYLTAADNVFSPEMYKNNSNGGYGLPFSLIFGLNLTF